MSSALRSRLHRAAAIVLAAAVVGAVGRGAMLVHRALPADGRPLHGELIGSRVLPSGQAFGPWLDERRQREARRAITLVHGGSVWRVPLGDLGIEVDVAQVMRNALEPGRTGSRSHRLAAILAARRGEIDVPLVYSIDTRRAPLALAGVASDVYREPADAQIDLSAHARIPEIPGQELDAEATVNRVLDALARGDDAVAVVTRDVPARVTAGDLGKVDISQVVSTFETRFSLHGVGANRGVNIARAARALDGVVLMPGQELSFNKAVGERTVDRGYAYAPEIVGDELQMGVGGGVCQVASTLHAAALFGALEITERWAHARPSSYTKLGLDATVFFGAKDLRFRNTAPYPVMLHVYLPESGLLRAEVLGGPPLAKVEYKYGVAKTEPFVRRITVKPFFAAGRSVRKQKGILGYSVSSLVRTTFADGRVVDRWYHSEYRPAPEVFWVSPDFDESKLPGLPAGAKGVEGRTTDTASASPNTG